jgi:uncharacterized protein DUF1573
MDMTIRPYLIPVCVLTALAAISAPLSAQEKKEGAAAQPAQQPAAQPAQQPAAQPPAANPAPVQPAQPVGPAAPKQPVIKSMPQNRVAPKPAADIPAATVVLKPGEVPAIKFDTPVYDFGRIRAGQDVVHDFWYTNTGTGPLELLRVRPSCGCTQAGAHDKIVQPGQTGKIPIKMSTGHAAGPVNKTVMVNTNVTGEGSNITLQIKGEVWQPLQTTPTSASFGRLTAESMKSATLERKLTVVNNTESKAVMTDVKSSSPSFKASVKELEPGKKFELTVSVVPPLSPGVVSGTIDIATGVTDMPKLQVPVSAYVTADVEITPNQLTLATNRPGAMQRQFFIRNNSPRSMKVTDLKASNEKLKVSILETQPVGMAYRVSLEIPADYQIPDKGDTITFKTDNDSVPNVTIPIKAAPAMTDVTSQFKSQTATRVVTPITEKDVAAMQNQPKKDDHAGHDHAAPAPAPATPVTPAPAGTSTGKK